MPQPPPYSRPTAAGGPRSLVPSTLATYSAPVATAPPPAGRPANAAHTATVDWTAVRYELSGWWAPHRRRKLLLAALPRAPPSIVSKSRPYTDWALVGAEMARHVMGRGDRDEIMDAFPPLLGRGWRRIWDEHSAYRPYLADAPGGAARPGASAAQAAPGARKGRRPPPLDLRAAIEISKSGWTKTNGTA